MKSAVLHAFMLIRDDILEKFSQKFEINPRPWKKLRDKILLQS